MKFEWAPSAFRMLNGVFCVYKPRGLTIGQANQVIKEKLVADLNKLPCYKYERDIKRSETDQMSNLPVPTTVPAEMTDLSDHRLVLGPRYIDSDIKLYPIPSRLKRFSSGVQMFGIGRGIADARIIYDSRFVRVYHVTGQFGMATQNFLPHGNIVQRTSYHHVKKSIIDKVCSSAQAGHTKLMFDYARLNIQSQEAYEAAKSGIVRPATTETPTVIYGIKCISFNLPYFTLEIHAINEDGNFFKDFVHNLGLAVRSTAVCNKVQRIRYGHFNLDHALLKKHWTLENIIANIQWCSENTEVDKLLTGPILSDKISYLDSS